MHNYAKQDTHITVQYELLEIDFYDKSYLDKVKNIRKNVNSLEKKYIYNQSFTSSLIICQQNIFEIHCIQGIVLWNVGIWK